MAKRKKLLAVLLAALAASATWADEEFDKLKSEYDEAVGKLSEQIKKLEAESEKPDFSKLPRPDRAFYPRFEAYAEKHGGQPAALPALAWLLENGGENRNLGWIVDRLREDHAADPAILQALESLGWETGPWNRDRLVPLYRRVIAENKDTGVKAAAAFNIAKTEYAERSPSEDAPLPTTELPNRRARELFGQVVRDYPGTKAAERAEGYIFELDHLQIGMKAPDFGGTDASEKEIKLSDFRGRVVVVDFWGFW